VVPIHEFGLLSADTPYFTMKLIKGKTLALLLDERPEPAGEPLRFLGILLQICQTIAYAHARGVIHRDPKPANIQDRAVLPSGGTGKNSPSRAAPRRQLSHSASLQRAYSLFHPSPFAHL
jgi:hypothetical protein